MDDWYDGAPQTRAPSYSSTDIESVRNSIFSSQYEDVAKGFKRTDHHSDSKNAAASAYNTDYANWELSKLDKLYDLQKMELEMQYNSAAAQKRRFMEAGINPYLAMSDNSNAGSVVAGGSPVSHGMTTPDLASASQAETAEFNALTDAAGQFNDSVSSFFRNDIMSQQAQQERFNTAKQAERFGYEIARNIAELREKKNKSKLDWQHIRDNERLYNELMQTQPERLQTPTLSNNLLRGQFDKVVAESKLADAKTQTENIMRDITYRAAEKQIKLTDAEIANLYASASHLSQLAQSIRMENNYMSVYGYENRGRQEFYNSYTTKQTFTNLVRTSNDLVDQLHNAKLISDFEAKQAKSNLQHMYVYNPLLAVQEGQYGLGALGWFSGISGINNFTHQFGNIFGGSGSAIVSKIAK